jgi:P27 family predicted phage terminase small subunit
LTARERRKWLELTGMLKEAGVMTVADVDALLAYVQIYWLWRDALDKIKVEGLMVPDEKTGFMVVHPMHRIRRDAQADLVKLMIEFGLTPASRSRVVSSKENQSLKREGFGGIKRG